MAIVVDIREQNSGAGATCRAILDTVPTWFGVGEANDHYVELADRTPTIVASVDGRDVGLLLLVRHSAYAAEVYLLAVVADLHRQGIGSRMLEQAEASLVAEGVEFLQVKTLSATHPDPGYALTRAFYLAKGFRPLEEFPTLWNPSNPALQLVKSLPSRT